MIHQHAIIIILQIQIHLRHSPKIISSETAVSTAVRTQLLLILPEPFLVLEGMTTVTAIFAPNDHPFTQATFANHAKFVAFAIAFGDGLFTPSTGDVVCSVSLSDISESFGFGHEDGVGCNLVEFEVVEKLNVGREYLMNELLGNERGRLAHETDSCYHCRLQ